MDNFNLIYKMLKAFEVNMDVEEPSWECIEAEQLGITEASWRNIMEMLVDAGYLEGIKVVETASGVVIKFIRPRLTLKGIEYLEKN